MPFLLTKKGFLRLRDPKDPNSQENGFFYSHRYVQIDVGQPSKHKIVWHNSLQFIDVWNHLSIELSKRSMDYHLTITMPMGVKE